MAESTLPSGDAPVLGGVDLGTLSVALATVSLGIGCFLSTPRPGPSS